MLAAMSRLDSYQERPEDRGDLVDVLALAVLYSRLCSDDAPFDRKAMRLVLDLYQRVSRPLILNVHSRSQGTFVAVMLGCLLRQCGPQSWAQISAR